MKFKGINYIYILGLIFISLSDIHAQMNVNGTLLYGNEWIEEGQEYYKVEVAYDGVFRITYADLINSGMNGKEIIGSQIALVHNGESVPIYVSTQEGFSEGDFVLFEGRKNRSFLDQFLIEGGEENLLNELYSFTSDISTYYISLSGSNTRFVTVLDNNIQGSLSPKPYAVQEDTVLNSSYFNKPYFKISNLSTYQSHYMRGEGFSSPISTVTRLSFMPHQYTATTDIDVSLRLKVSSEYKSFSETQTMEMNINGNVLVEEEYGSFEMKEYNFTIPDDYLTSSIEKVEIKGLVDRYDRYTVPYGILKYPRLTNAISGMYFQDELTEQRYYEIGEFASSESAWLFAGDYIMRTVVENDLHKIAVDNRISGKFTIYDESAIEDLSVIAAHKFVDFSEIEQADLVFITTDELKATVPSISRYKDYRQTEEGGDYQASIVTVEELYETYGYGVSNHQMSIKNFIAYGVSQHKLRHVFFIGKGLQYHEIRTEADRLEDGKEEFQLPAFGYPSSDNLYASLVDRLEQYATIGRLAYNTEKEISLYLDKVIDRESKPYTKDVQKELWRNRLIHLNGGGGGEHQAIDAAFNRIENVIARFPFTPSIYEYIKTSQSPIEYENLEEIINQVNKGAFVFNFFGHASSSGFNIDINRPKQYHNEHLPLLIGLGCSAGNYNTVGESIGEIYCGYDNGGFIGVLATTHYSTIGDLAVMGEKLYEEFFGSADKTFGEMFRDAMNSVGARGIRRGAEQIMYMGDPCLRLQVPRGVDVALDKESVTTEPFQLSTELDSLKLDFDIINIGLIPDIPFSLIIEHKKPDGSIVSVVSEDIRAESFRNHFTYRIAIDSSMAGSNYFNVMINGDKNLSELPDPEAYRNNSFSDIFENDGLEVFISDNDVKNSFPKDYAIVPSQEIELMVYGSPVTENSFEVFFEIDTTLLFNSPLQEKGENIFYGGGLSFKPEIPFIDSTVYYWRSGYISNNDTVWKTSSFVYIPEKTGWNQSHYYQFLENTYDGIELNDNRVFSTTEYITAVQIYNSLYSNFKGLRYNVNGQNYNQPDFWMPRFTGAYVIAHYPGRFQWLYSPPGGHYGSYNPRSRDQRATAFSLDTLGGRRDLINYLENVLEDDMYIAVLFSVYDSKDSFNIEEWAADSLVLDGKNIFNVLEKYGATKVRELKTRIDAPYGFFFTKNGLVFDEEIGEDENDQIKINGNLPYPNIDGSFYTLLIDNASAYQILEYQFEDLEESDTSILDLIDMLGTEIVYSGERQLRETVDISELPKNTITRLSLYLNDSLNFSLPQLDYWRLYYDEIPDYAIGGTELLTVENKEVDNNTSIPLEFLLYNISSDTLYEIGYNITITNSKNVIILDTQLVNNKVVAPYQKIELAFPAEISTRSSFLEIKIELNKERKINESEYNNNILIKRVRVIQDKYDPNLIVLFDGKVIEDQEAVATDVEIEIILEDVREIPHLRDTSLINFTIYDPNDKVMDRFSYGSDYVEFIPSQLPGGNASVIIKGDFPTAGLHVLKVNAIDNASNESGELDYFVAFRIEPNNAISRVINIPNPFAESTHFAYKLTGLTAPQNYRVLVVDATGQLVSSLTEDDLGPLRIGNHRTDNGWDGRNESGALLPSGVYFYKLEVLDENVKYNHLRTKYDIIPETNWGKMMIMRN